MVNYLKEKLLHSKNRDRSKKEIEYNGNVKVIVQDIRTIILDSDQEVEGYFGVKNVISLLDLRMLLMLIECLLIIRLKKLDAKEFHISKKAVDLMVCFMIVLYRIYS